MKKELIKYFVNIGAECSYSGKEKIFYVKHRTWLPHRRLNNDLPLLKPAPLENFICRANHEFKYFLKNTNSKIIEQ